MEHMTYRNKDGKEALKDIDFQVKAGEIVGIVGVEGNGQTELVDALFGYKKITSGAILLNGTDISKMWGFPTSRRTVWYREALQMEISGRTLSAVFTVSPLSAAEYL